MTLNKSFDLMLRAAYQYYWSVDGDTIMSDYDYDNLTKRIAANFKKITSQDKHLVDFEALKTCSSLHYISKKDYPKHAQVST